MTDVFEFSEYDRNDLKYSFITLTPEEVVEKKENFEKMEAEKARLKAEAAAKKAEEVKLAAEKAAAEKKASEQSQEPPKEN